MPDDLSSILVQGSFVISGIGILLFAYFMCAYALPGGRLRAALETLSQKIKDEAAIADSAMPPEKIAPLFDASAEWRDAWAEYERTLQIERGSVDGEERVIGAKAGATVASILGRAALIDGPLETEYFRPLPALLSVFGIVAFLMALASVALQGEQPFEAAIADIAAILPAAMQQPIILSAFLLSLAPLIFSIAASGFFSATSASLAPHVDEITLVLDALYGHVEEPGESQKEKDIIVVAEEAPAAPAPSLAQALEEVLAAQIARQTASFETAAANIGAEISRSVTAALEKPLGQILKAAETSTMQTERMGRVLQDTVSSMSREIGQSIARTFEQPLGRMEQIVGQSGRQAENVDRVLQGTMTSIVEKIEATFSAQIKGLNALLLENAQSLHDMRQNVAQMMEDLKQNTEYISGLTRSSIEKMDASAQTILDAAQKFGEAGDVMNSQISHSHSLSRHMMESGMALNASAQTLTQVVSDYGHARDSIGALINTLQESVREIDKKVMINKSLVEDMQKVSDRLKEVQGQTDEYLHKVSDVLSSGFNDFGKSVHDNLDRSTSAFYTSMSNSVELISVQMRNLTAALQDLPELLRKPA